MAALTLANGKSARWNTIRLPGTCMKVEMLKVIGSLSDVRLDCLSQIVAE